MKFNNIHEAAVELQKYANWQGVIWEGQTIKGTFVGISDKEMSKAIWRGFNQQLPEHNFTAEDLKQIEFWVAFADHSIKNVKEVLQDNYMVELCEHYALRHVIELTNFWSIPIRIPPGLHTRIIFKDEAIISIKIADRIHPEKEYIDGRERGKGDMTNFFFEDRQVPIHEMEYPEISVRATDLNPDQREIVILFSWILDRHNIH